MLMGGPKACQRTSRASRQAKSHRGNGNGVRGIGLHAVAGDTMCRSAIALHARALPHAVSLPTVTGAASH
jgi:hypothetical protein